MNLSSTSKLSGNALGNLALTASFVLHVGLIAGFSSWQLFFESPSKERQKVIRVRILTTSTTQKDTQKPIPKKTAHFFPTQPMAVSSPSMPTLTIHTPEPPVPTLQPLSQVKELISFPKMQLKPHRAQRIPITDKATRPRAILLAKTIRQNRSSKQKINIRPSPAHNALPTESVQPTSPTSVRESNQLGSIQPKSPARLAGFPKVAARFPQTVFAVETPTHQLNDIRPRSTPTPSQATASLETSPAAQQTIKTFMSSAKSQTKLTALPRNLTQNPSGARNTSGTDLNALRGLFTGKVRQRIANAKHYPRTARRRGMEGQPVIAFSLNREGRLMKVDLVQTSGYQMLDQAALEAVQHAAPYPEIPAELKANTYQFKLPIYFVLK